MGNTTSTSSTKGKSSQTSEVKEEPPVATNDVSTHESEEIDEEGAMPEFQVLSAAQRSVTFDERQCVTISSTAPLSDFRPLQRAATYDPRLRTKRSLLTADDVMHRRFFNARERRRSAADVSSSIVSTLQKPSKVKDEVLEKKNAIVVVDPFSTGTTLAQKALARGYSVVGIYSDTLEVMQELIAHVPKELSAQFTTTLVHDASNSDSFDEIVGMLKDMSDKSELNIIGVLAGAETGVMLADKLSETLHLTTNGTKGSDARRNKYKMGEKVRSSGLRAVKQRAVTKWSQVVEFVEQELQPDPFRVIVKPVESAGSDDVTLCYSMEDVRRAFGNIQGKINSLGLENTMTLVQEYLDGTEYVVDTVSRDGVHKVVAVWEYDKRAVNNAPFVYYGVLLRPASGPLVTPIVDYILKVVDALEIKHGPAHAEVKLTQAGEPCLIEIGSRCHGGGGAYLDIVNPCIGYNQVECTLDAYFDADAFDALPKKPSTLKKHGCEAMLVSYEQGKLKSYPGLEELRSLSSYVTDYMILEVGDELPITVDMYGTPGSILMVHEDKETLDRDYARIRELEHDGMYDIEPTKSDADEEKKEVVVVVDPFTTGAVVAHQLIARGYDCICVYSDKLENVEHIASLIPEGLTLEFAATVAYDGDVAATAKAVRNAAKRVVDKSDDSPPLSPRRKDQRLVKAVFPGAELGVRLADALSDELGLVGNELSLSSARRDKYLMGEKLRSSGVRAVKQVKATSWEEAEHFITHELQPEPFEVVLKPLESAGTEDVVLCMSMEQAKETFGKILGKINGLGIANNAVLLQEYLDGDEYVIDTVSRDGKHKVVCVWKYDKRRVNDAAFVYFGLSVVPCEGFIHELIEYQLQVLDALGIKNGPAHGEVKLCRGSPVLIEVGARCHGGEGAWIPIVNKCVGYNQVDAAIDSILDADAFDKYPDRPTQLLEHGCEAMLVSYKEGILKSVPGLEEIIQMPAFLKKEIFVSKGDALRRTIDMFSTPGSIMLTHKDKQVLEANLSRIRELEIDGLFELE